MSRQENNVLFARIRLLRERQTLTLVSSFFWSALSDGSSKIVWLPSCSVTEGTMSAPQVPNYGIVCKSYAAVDSIFGSKAQKSLNMFKINHLCPVPRVSLDRVLDRLRAPVGEGHEVGSPGPAALPPLLVAELGGDAAGALGRRALFYWTISGVAVCVPLLTRTALL